MGKWGIKGAASLLWPNISRKSNHQENSLVKLAYDSNPYLIKIKFKFYPKFNQVYSTHPLESQLLTVKRTDSTLFLNKNFKIKVPGYD